MIHPLGRLYLIVSVLLIVVSLTLIDCRPTVHLEFGSNIPSRIQKRVKYWKENMFLHREQYRTELDAIRIVISLGDTTLARSMIPQDELYRLPPQSFIVRSNFTRGSNVLLVVGNGRSDAYEKRVDSATKVNMGAVYACYYVIEKILGISFMAHPFQPQRSNELALNRRLERLLQSGGALNVIEQPQWNIRGIHIHTMHPLELTELLNGFGKNLSIDTWEITSEYDMFCEWLVANRQNRLEWVLLWSESWSEYADSELRKHRLRALVERAHEYGLLVGIDVPIALRQQHSWSLIRPGDKRDPIEQIQSRLDYIAPVFDFLGTSLGFSEFTHGSATDMVRFLNETSRYLDENHGGRRVSAKVHCSQGQIVAEYADPMTGNPGCNFNFLPFYSDQRVGVFPHTVQIYSLDDPAFTYGNDNFTYMGEFMYAIAKKQNREVIWFPETAYWVDYDINVPLMLPVYAHRRVQDFHSIAHREKRDGFQIDGTFFFSSGWEFTYWLNDVLNMRASWNPHVELSVDEAVKKLLMEFSQVFDNGLDDAHSVSDNISQEIFHLMKQQIRLLILGNQTDTRKVELRNGIAYLQGGDTWSEISALVSDITGRKIETNPRRISLSDVATSGGSLDGTVDYKRDIQPLLADMHKEFISISSRLAQFRSKVPSEAIDLFDEILDSSQILADRASFQFYLYEYATVKWKRDQKTYMEAMRKKALDSIRSAETLIKRRMDNFRVPVDVVAGWRPNPTAYEFTYLYHARTLYFWWRDYGRIVHDQISPCYMNLISPIDVVIGEGVPQTVIEFIKEFFEQFKWLKWVAECLAAPKMEPIIPPFEP